MRRRWWLVGVVLLLAIPLLWLLREFTRDVILTHALRIVWEIGVFLDSLPQAPLWMGIVAVIVYLALMSLMARPGPRPGRQWPFPDRAGRLHILALRIQRATESEYYRWVLAGHLGSIIVAELAHQQGMRRGEVRHALRTGHLDAPEEIQAYLRVGFSPLPTRAPGLLTRVRRLFTPGAPVTPLDLDLERVVCYMESLMEVERDR